MWATRHMCLGFTIRGLYTVQSEPISNSSSWYQSQRHQDDIPRHGVFWVRISMLPSKIFHGFTLNLQIPSPFLKRLRIVWLARHMCLGFGFCSCKIYKQSKILLFPRIMMTTYSFPSVIYKHFTYVYSYIYIYIIYIIYINI